MLKRNLVVLLIDDDYDDWEIFSLAVKKIDNSIKCLHINSCEDAITALISKKVQPDYVFLDLNMPGMQGHECLLQVKKTKHLQAVPIIIYSTSNHPLERKELLAAGASFYICKTNTFNELIDQLKLVIANHLELA